jgi:hypothetical protein
VTLIAPAWIGTGIRTTALVGQGSALIASSLLESMSKKSPVKPIVATF